MSLEVIYVVRHGFRSSWSVDHTTGVYTASIPSPTGIAVDPALTAHGVEQAQELGSHLMTLDPPIEAVYSSPFYRCLQTLSPFIGLQQRQHDQWQLETGLAQHVVGGGDASLSHASSSPSAAACTIRPEHGLCEWFGSAPFEQPGPASTATLKTMFPALDESYVSGRYPSKTGETLAQLQERVSAGVQSIIQQCDAENRRAVVLSTHAAVVIMLGRILTGNIPESVDTDDFRAFTCGLSVFRRRDLDSDEKDANRVTQPIAKDDLTVGSVGNWICESNSDCSFLRSGEERGWMFSGDEAFAGTGSMSQGVNGTPKL